MTKQTIVQARASRNMTQLKLAYEAGIRPATLSLIECRHCGTTKKTFLKLCKVLDVDPCSITGVLLKKQVGKSRWVTTEVDDEVFADENRGGTLVEG